MRFAVLASGAGSNLQALIDRAHGHNGNQLVAFGTDKPQAAALERAHAASIPTKVFPAAQYPSREARDLAMANWLGDGHRAELVVLAGYTQLVTQGSSTRFRSA